MAAALLRQHLHSRSVEHVIVASAGLWAVPGRGADPRALLIAREFGLSLNDHRAHPLTPELVQASEAICVMDYLNEAELVARFPAAERKVFLLGAMDRIDRGGQVEIPDPYDGDLSDVRRCYQALDSKIRKLADRIKAALPGAPEQS
jgi:protein-tyrosine phosphatase